MYFIIHDCTQAIVAAGCLVGLADQLRDSRNVPESVLSEVSAALAVLASDGEPIINSTHYNEHSRALSRIYTSLKADLVSV